MAINSLFDKLFGKADKTPKAMAKDRLQLVLMHDRADIPAPILEAIRQEFMVVLRKHLIIDEQDLDIGLTRDDGAVALVANIPFRRIRTEAPIDGAA